jgi:arginine decarboxylase-like protein
MSADLSELLVVLHSPLHADLLLVSCLTKSMPSNWAFSQIAPVLPYVTEALPAKHALHDSQPGTAAESILLSRSKLQ